MEIVTTSIKDLVIIKPTVFADDRGYFLESYNEAKFQELGISTHFVQDNESSSSKGVLRGLHFQKPPFAQAKLIRVIKGAVLDIAVDLRKQSKSYGRWEAIELNEDNKWMFYIPEGFAHGFLALENETIFTYKCSHLYNKEAEGALRWDDPDLSIDWGITTPPTLSEKDKIAPLFSNFSTPF